MSEARRRVLIEQHANAALTTAMDALLACIASENQW